MDGTERKGLSFGESCFIKHRVFLESHLDVELPKNITNDGVVVNSSESYFQANLRCAHKLLAERYGADLNQTVASPVLLELTVLYQDFHNLSIEDFSIPHADMYVTTVSTDDSKEEDQLKNPNIVSEPVY